MFLALTVSLPAGAGADERCPPAIRALDRDVLPLLARGTHSPTFQRLIDALRASTVIVHVTWDRFDPQRPHGRAIFVTTAGRYRYVRIVLSGTMSLDAAVALLGHELQHAREVADAAWVVDAATYHALYRAIGVPSCSRLDACFDTDAAWQSGVRVLQELRRTARHRDDTE